jgi:hypothetical protein
MLLLLLLMLLMLLMLLLMLLMLLLMLLMLLMLLLMLLMLLLMLLMLLMLLLMRPFPLSSGAVLVGGLASNSKCCFQSTQSPLASWSVLALRRPSRWHSSIDISSRCSLIFIACCFASCSKRCCSKNPTCFVARRSLMTWWSGFPRVPSEQSERTKAVNV